MRLVMKFGGASMAKGELMKKAVELVKKHIDEGTEIVVVISAMKGVTDELLDAAKKAKEDRLNIPKFVNTLYEKHKVAAREAISTDSVFAEIEHKIEAKINELEKLLTGIRYLKECTPRSYDAVAAFGEILSTLIVYGSLRSVNLNAEYFTGGEAGIVTNSYYGEARPILPETQKRVQEKLLPLLERGVIPVVAGFIAMDADGNITTLGRGGSDYTAAILGVALNVDEIWMWKDVDGVMTADPDVVSNAVTLPEISYAEVMELTYFGAEILHPKTIEPAMEKSIPVYIKNFFNPDHPGTVIKQRANDIHGIVKAVSKVDDAAIITVGGAGMIGVPGVTARVFGTLDQNKIHIIMISQSSSEANISFVVPRSDLKKALKALKKEFKNGRVVRDIWYNADISVIAVVGGGMRGRPGTAARIFTSIGKRNVNILMIAQGSSELNISFAVRSEDANKAIQAIHEEFELGVLGKTKNKRR